MSPKSCINPFVLVVVMVKQTLFTKLDEGGGHFIRFSQTVEKEEMDAVDKVRNYWGSGLFKQESETPWTDS